MPNPKQITVGVLFNPVCDFETSKRYWCLIEELGFDRIWLPDHFYNIYDAETSWMETWVALTALAGVTSQIQIGSLVSNFIYHNPAQLARQAATLSHYSAGRLTLGVGAGSYYDRSHSMSGVARWALSERIDRLREGVEIICKLSSADSVSFQGQYYQCKGGTLSADFAGPQQKPPLLVAAHRRETIAIAAQRADIWNTLIGQARSREEEIAQVSEQLESLSRALDEAGRDPDTLTRSLLIGATPQQVYSSSSQLIDYINSYVKLGFSDFNIIFSAGGSFPPYIQHLSDIESLESIAGEVLSAFR